MNNIDHGKYLYNVFQCMDNNKDSARNLKWAVIGTDIFKTKKHKERMTRLLDTSLSDHEKHEILHSPKLNLHEWGSLLLLTEFDALKWTFERIETNMTGFIIQKLRQSLEKRIEKKINQKKIPSKKKPYKDLPKKSMYDAFILEVLNKTKKKVLLYDKMIASTYIINKGSSNGKEAKKIMRLRFSFLKIIDICYIMSKIDFVDYSYMIRHSQKKDYMPDLYAESQLIEYTLRDLDAITKTKPQHFHRLLDHYLFRKQFIFYIRNPIHLYYYAGNLYSPRRDYDSLIHFIVKLFDIIQYKIKYRVLTESKSIAIRSEKQQYDAIIEWLTMLSNQNPDKLFPDNENNKRIYTKKEFFVPLGIEDIQENGWTYKDNILTHLFGHDYQVPYALLNIMQDNKQGVVDGSSEFIEPLPSNDKWVHSLKSNFFQHAFSMLTKSVIDICYHFLHKIDLYEQIDAAETKLVSRFVDNKNFYGMRALLQNFPSHNKDVRNFYKSFILDSLLNESYNLERNISFFIINKFIIRRDEILDNIEENLYFRFLNENQFIYDTGSYDDISFYSIEHYDVLFYYFVEPFDFSFDNNYFLKEIVIQNGIDKINEIISTAEEGEYDSKINELVDLIALSYGDFIQFLLSHKNVIKNLMNTEPNGFSALVHLIIEKLTNKTIANAIIEIIEEKKHEFNEEYTSEGFIQFLIREGINPDRIDLNTGLIKQQI